MKLSLREAIIVAISYADIFDFPLTEGELEAWVPHHIDKKKLSKEIVNLPEGIVRKDRYFMYGFRKKLSRVRRSRKSYSKKKLVKAKSYIKFFRLIPTIQMAGVTGSVAIENAKNKDDIDIFIVTKSKCLWITRLLIVVLLDLFKIRRKPSDKKVQDKFCLNMFISKDQLQIPRQDRNLYTAHELMQMIPLINRNNTYENLISSNTWTQQYVSIKRENPGCAFYKNNCVIQVLTKIIGMFEKPARKLQLAFMKDRRTTETITQYQLRFHPLDARIWVRKALKKRLNKYNLSLDNIF